MTHMLLDLRVLCLASHKSNPSLFIFCLTTNHFLQDEQWMSGSTIFSQQELTAFQFCRLWQNGCSRQWSSEANCRKHSWCVPVSIFCRYKIPQCIHDQHLHVLIQSVKLHTVLNALHNQPFTKSLGERCVILIQVCVRAFPFAAPAGELCSCNLQSYRDIKRQLALVQCYTVSIPILCSEASSGRTDWFVVFVRLIVAGQHSG